MNQNQEAERRASKAIPAAGDSSGDLPLQEIDLREFFLTFWDQRIFILCVAALTVAVAAAMAFTAKPEYVSTSKFIGKNSSGAGNSQLSGLAQLAGFSLPNAGAADPFDHIDVVMKNMDLVQKLIDKKWDYKGDSLTLVRIWEMKPDTTAANWEYAFNRKVANRIRKQTFAITPEKGLKVLTINALDPYLAYQMNQYLLGLINDYMINNIRSQATENRLFVEGRIQEIKAELAQSEEELKIFQMRNQERTSPPIALEYKRLLRNVSINEELFLQLKKQYELSRIEEKKDQPLIILVSKPEINLDRSKPNRKRALVIGAFLGVCFGLMAAYVRTLVRKLSLG